MMWERMGNMVWISYVNSPMKVTFWKCMFFLPNIFFDCAMVCRSTYCYCVGNLKNTYMNQDKANSKSQ
jgi:hypothetical protein